MTTLDYHLSPEAFARQFRLGYANATAHRTCVNCCYGAFASSRGGLHCQHPLVKPRQRVAEGDAGRKVVDCDRPLALNGDTRDVCCDEFSEMFPEGTARIDIGKFRPDRFRIPDTSTRQDHIHP